MSIRSKSSRIFILVIVAAFALSSLGLSGLVIWDALKGDEQVSSEDIQKQLEEQQKQNPSVGKKLEGYKPVSEVPKLKVVDLKEGSGKEVTPDSTVTADYTGALAKTGVIFESSSDSGQPATFALKEVIKGWQEGVPGMKEGGKRRLIIPAELAYGEQGRPPSIGPNEPLVFDIQLVSVK